MRLSGADLRSAQDLLFLEIVENVIDRKHLWIRIINERYQVIQKLVT